MICPRIGDVPTEEKQDSEVTHSTARPAHVEPLRDCEWLERPLDVCGQGWSLPSRDDW